MEPRWKWPVYAGVLLFLICLSIESVRSARGNLALTSDPRGQHGSSKLRHGVLQRSHRQAEASYEEGVEYEYEEEEEQGETSPTREPEQETTEPDAEVEAETEAEKEAEADVEEEEGTPEGPAPEREGDGDEYYEYEEEKEREREAEEERKEEMRKEQERREEEEREEEDRKEEERRKAERKEQERLEEQERFEEEERMAKERRAELERMEERRKEEERRMKEYEASLEEEEEPEPIAQTTTPAPDELEPEVEPSAEEVEEAEAATTPPPPEEIEEEETEPEREPEREELEEVSREYGPTESEELATTTTTTPIPIVETGRNDLERYTTTGSEEYEDNFERVDEAENREVEASEEVVVPVAPASEEIPEVKPEVAPDIDNEVEEPEPTEAPEIPEEVVEETEDAVEGSSEEAYPLPTTTEIPITTTTTYPSTTTPPPREEIILVTQPPQISFPIRPYQPYQPPVTAEHVPEETRDPNEYEVEPPASSENEIEIEHFPLPTPAQPTTPVPKFEEIERPEKADERDRYLHEFEEDEDEEEETERYEGRRFNGQTRQPDIPSIPPPNTRPSQVTELSRVPDDSENEVEVDEELTPSTTPQPERQDNSISKSSSASSSSSSSESVEVPERPQSKRPGQHFDLAYPEFNGQDSSESELGRGGMEAIDNNRIEETHAKIECFPGYELSPDGMECLDLNECEQGVCGSTQICTNLPGTFRCSCNPGFIKDFRNEKVCRDLNECEIGNGGCSQDCINTQGSFYCSCAPYYELSRDGRTCIHRPPTTTSTTTTTTTTTTTPPPPTTTTTTAPTTTTTTTTRIPAVQFVPERSSSAVVVEAGNEDNPIRNCATPPVPKGAGIAYLYCSRSPVGIHHRHSQLERRLIQDWTARKNKNVGGNSVRTRQFRGRRNLNRKPRQTTYSPGSMCELRCRSGFELKGQYTLHCNASTGNWHGTTNGFCEALPKVDNQNLPVISGPEPTPSNEIPRLSPNEISGFAPAGSDFDKTPFRTTFRPIIDLPTAPTTPFRPIFHKPPPAATRPPGRINYPAPATRFTDLTESHPYWRPPVTLPTTPSTTTTTRRPYYNYYSPITYRPVHTTPTTTTTPLPPTTTNRNNFIQLTYRFKTPWIRCPDDIRIDLQPNQNLAYVIIPQPQTNVDWWRQVTSEPAWAKGLETETGPGKQRITFRARTSAPLNNTAECSFTLEVRDTDPPRVRECPESFSVSLNPGQTSRVTTWVEPHFSDNVRVSSVKKSHEPGAMLPVGEHLISYEATDPSENKARCSFTINMLPPPVSSNNYQSNHRKPVNTEGITNAPPIGSTSSRPEVHATMRNVVCHVGKKGRRIVFQSRVIPRGCTEMTLDMAGENPGSVDTLNTVTQNSAENSATSQISSVSFSSHDNPQSASAFSQAVSNGRNSNRMVHSKSSVTNGAHGTNSKSSSYAISVSSSSRNFDLPFLAQDKQVYDEDFVIPTTAPGKTRSGQWGGNSDNLEEGAPRRQGGRPNGRRFGNGRGGNRRLQNNNDQPNQNMTRGHGKKFFRHFDSWDTNGHSSET